MDEKPITGHGPPDGGIRKSKYEIGIHHNKVDVQWDVRRIEKCNLVLAIYIASVVVYSKRGNTTKTKY